MNKPSGVTKIRSSASRPWSRGVGEQLQLLAGRLETRHRTRHPGAFVELSNWNHALIGRTAEVAVELDDGTHLGAFVTCHLRNVAQFDWDAGRRHSHGHSLSRAKSTAAQCSS
jgi:hypothetical protein